MCLSRGCSVLQEESAADQTSVEQGANQGFPQPRRSLSGASPSAHTGEGSRRPSQRSSLSSPLTSLTIPEVRSRLSLAPLSALYNLAAARLNLQGSCLQLYWGGQKMEEMQGLGISETWSRIAEADGCGLWAGGHRLVSKPQACGQSSPHNKQRQAAFSNRRIVSVPAC